MAIIVLVILAAIVYFGFNSFRGASIPSTANINVSLPSTGGAGAGTGAAK